MRIPKAWLVKELRANGYAFKRRGRRRELWKRQGGTERVDIPRSKTVPLALAKTVLIQAGLPPADVAHLLDQWERDQGAAQPR